MHEKNAPTIKPGGFVTFYNPGDRLSEPLNYSIEGADIHTVARFVIESEEKSLFRVPTEIKFLADNSRVKVDFPTTVCLKFKDRGLVMIDEEWSPSGDEEEDDKAPFARTEAEAREKGDRIWRQYLWTIVRRWQALCNEIRAKGGVPEEAQGFTKRALRILGMRDPAIAGQNAIQAEQSEARPATENQRIADLENQLKSTQEMLTKVLGRLGAQDEAEVNESVERVAARTRGRNNQNK